MHCFPFGHTFSSDPSHLQYFIASCCFDELSRESFSCLLIASFRSCNITRHNIFYAKINDQSVCRGNRGQLLAQWRRGIASRVALVLLRHRSMCSALHQRIVMAIKNGPRQRYIRLLPSFFCLTTHS